MKVILLGPTAVGKTTLSLQLAQTLHAPIISADSRQCYKYLNIGTAKPTFRELCRARHFNISCLDLTKSESASAFLNRVKNWEQMLTQKYNHILYCGGSTLHLRVLIEPFDDNIPQANEKNIKKLEKTIETKGITHLYNRLQAVDPEYVQNMDGMNPQRIIRALDVWMQTGKPFSKFHKTSRTEITPDADTLVIGLRRNRKELYRRINLRTKKMIQKGLIKETSSILESGYSPRLHSLNTVGYKQVIDYLNNHISIETMLNEIQTKTRRYAKRQLTWFRKWNFIQWLNMDTLTTNQATAKIIKMVEHHSNNG